MNASGLRRGLALLGVALPLVFLADLRSVEATCGGGGGGGMGGGSSSGGSSSSKEEPAYYTEWTSNFEAAKEKVWNGRKAVILYFQPEGSKEMHPFFRTKMMQDISNEHAVLKFAYAKDHEIRLDLKIHKDRHVLTVCDWFANPLKDFEAATLKQKFPYPSIDVLLKHLQEVVKVMLKKLEVNLKNAEKRLEKDDAPGALKALGDLLTLKGHEIVQRAKPVIEKITETAVAEIEAALKTDDKKASAKELRKIKTRYRDLKSVQQRCDKEIEAATGMAPSPDDGSSLVRSDAGEAVDALLATIDFAKRAPSPVERSYQAMCEGLRCEIREEYEKALEFYAMAAGLDPKDSIALTYLGELYRHHLGRWSDARRAFERVVELDNNDLAMAVSLHGLGKMTIWEGRNEEGLKLFEQSLRRRPTAICFRNLAVFWNTENDFKKAFAYATQAFALDENDPYNQVFYAVYLLLDNQAEKAEALIRKAQFDPSMSYNYACYYAAQGRHELVMKYLHRHFYGYEKFDDVRGFEMAEARMDIHFRRYKDDPRFLELTALAAK